MSTSDCAHRRHRRRLRGSLRHRRGSVNHIGQVPRKRTPRLHEGTGASGKEGAAEISPCDPRGPRGGGGGPLGPTVINFRKSEPAEWHAHSSPPSPLPPIDCHSKARTDAAQPALRCDVPSQVWMAVACMTTGPARMSSAGRSRPCSGARREEFSWPCPAGWTPLRFCSRRPRWRGERTGVASLDHGLRPDLRGRGGAGGRARHGLGAWHFTPRRWAWHRVRGPRRGPGPPGTPRSSGSPSARGTRRSPPPTPRDDQAETLLMRLARGSALRGAAAIRAGGPRLLRPLLTVRRADTEALVAAAGLEPVRDPSNDDPGLFRTRIRHHVLPVLRQAAGSGVVERLARFARSAAEDEELLAGLAAQALERVRDGAGLDAVGVRALAWPIRSRAAPRLARGDGPSGVRPAAPGRGSGDRPRGPHRAPRTRGARGGGGLGARPAARRLRARPPCRSSRPGAPVEFAGFRVCARRRTGHPRRRGHPPADRPGPPPGRPGRPRRGAHAAGAGRTGGRGHSRRGPRGLAAGRRRAGAGAVGGGALAPAAPGAGAVPPRRATGARNCAGVGHRRAAFVIGAGPSGRGRAAGRACSSACDWPDGPVRMLDAGPRPGLRRPRPELKGAVHKCVPATRPSDSG